MTRYAGRRLMRNQAGDGKVGLVIGILVVVGLIYFLKLAVPPRITAAELREEVERLTRQYVVQQLTYDQLVVQILDEAGKAGVPIKEDDIRIVESEGRVRVSLRYKTTQKLVGGKEWVRTWDVEADVPKL